MDKSNRRLMEISGHLDAITEQMKANKVVFFQSTLLVLYAEEIKDLADEMKSLLDSMSNLEG